MRHHVVCLVGDGDRYRAEAAGGEARIELGLGISRPDISVRNDVMPKLLKAGLYPDDATLDLLNLAIAAYSADFRVRRQTAYDRWTRDIILHLPVVDVGLWRESTDTLVKMLGFLTGDHWEVVFRGREPIGPPQGFRSRRMQPGQAAQVCLFSGGLDSFVGALDLLEAGGRPTLVGHYGSGGATSSAQKEVWSVLDRSHEGRYDRFGFYLLPPYESETDRELTSRARSILFLALGVLVASCRAEESALFVPENGLISLNVPLTPSRMGSLSTRTTHPYFLGLLAKLLRHLGIRVSLETPYRFQTKGEMLGHAKNRTLVAEGARKTVSCSHPDVGRFHRKSPGQHCGYCVPCIIRRASMREAGLDRPEDYLVDVIADPPDVASDTGHDLRAFQMAVERVSTSGRARLLFDVIDTGPVPPGEIAGLVDVYRRGMEEVRRFLRGGS
ncbi:Qat anti-phage system QueC-like protein QatC [Tautonia sociabilis]|uniref:ATPase n=1 Tax=Tautonia sociabilis TaxID=2080755 RepID=A0A432MLH5_9BACT|nr:Qat anti-phage system QueC-like protein QatC [Tautonia sociabilis]RUL87986.1 hypothetical protein TsocGM_09700 [Tautonia sociabilis]